MKGYRWGLLLLIGAASFVNFGCAPQVRLKTTTEHQAAADALSRGEFREVSDEVFLFSMGAAEDVMDKCNPQVDDQIRIDLAPFVTAALWQGATGNKYRFGDDLSDLSDAMRDQAKSQGAFFAGVVAARNLKCVEPAATRIVENAHKLSVEMKGGPDGMRSEFIRSCAPRHGAGTCSCVALAGLAADTNVFQKTYSQELVYELMQRSPMNAMQIVMGCGLTEY